MACISKFTDKKTVYLHKNKDNVPITMYNAVYTLARHTFTYVHEQSV